jgi:hypothetical protein
VDYAIARQTDRQTDRQTERQTDRKTDRQKDGSHELKMSNKDVPTASPLHPIHLRSLHIGDQPEPSSSLNPAPATQYLPTYLPH